ncbi:MAG: hypothetical protein J1G05_00750 [Clostridiales bacterium]|nr:hypothetical protein [Clostridiales bacterium]
MPNIRDIIEKEASDVSIFKKYVQRGKVADKILTSFKKTIDLKRGVPLYLPKNSAVTEANDNLFGVISNCMALSTLLELFSLDVKPDKCEKEFTSLIELVFASVYKDGQIIFDASPYYSDSGEVTTYIETVSKLLIVMTDLRDWLITTRIEKREIPISITVSGSQITTTDALIEKTVELIKKCIKTLIDGCLPVKAPFEYEINGMKPMKEGCSSKVDFKGWTFQVPDASEAQDYSASIYFTYHAINAFLSFYNSFREIFDEKYEGIQIDIKSKKVEDIKKLEINRKFIDENFAQINTFRQRVCSSGRYFESKLKENGVDIAFDYIDKDLKAVSLPSLLSSGYNNYAMNTLFVLAIMIGSGIDDDYALINKLDDFYNQVQYVLNNVKKAYSIMKTNGREEFISTYRLIFDENYPVKQLNLVQNLRKSCKNVTVFDYVPLYCITYATISEFLIKYPQKEMQENIELIMENCMDGNEWLWDNGGFNVNNHLYYVFALEKFYDYYNNFEVLYVSDKAKLRSDLNKERKEKEEILNSYNNLKIEKEALIEKFELEKQQLQNNQNILLDIGERVKKVAENVLIEGFDKLVNEYFENIVRQVEEFALIVTQKRANVGEYNNKPYEAIYEKFPQVSRLQEMLELIKYCEGTSQMEKLKDIYGIEKDEDALSNIKKNAKQAIIDKIKYR